MAFRHKLAIGISAMVFAWPAFGQALDHGLGRGYVGGGFGVNNAKEDCGTPAGPCGLDRSGWRAFAGYVSQTHLAVEVGYADLGEVGAVPPHFAPGTRVDVQAVDVSALLVATPVRALSVLFRLGMYYNSPKTRPTYGLGLGYELNRTLGLRAEWQRYDQVEVFSGRVTATATMELLSLSGVIRFP